MYGKTDTNESDVRQIRNESVWTNLIMIAGNEKIMDSLDTVTRLNLIKLICSYTEANVEAIMNADTIEKSVIIKHLKK